MSNPKHSKYKMLKYIIEYKRENGGDSPSVREISKACEIPSTSNVQRILLTLQDEGHIERVRGANRLIKVTGGGFVYARTLWLEKAIDEEDLRG